MVAVVARVIERESVRRKQILPAALAQQVRVYAFEVQCLQHGQREAISVSDKPGGRIRDRKGAHARRRRTPLQTLSTLR